MSTELLTSWSEYHQAIDKVLPLAQTGIWIYDPSLAELKLDSSHRIEILRTLLQGAQHERIRLAVRDITHFRLRCPRLMELLRLHAHQFSVLETHEKLASLRDCMLLIDGRHGLIRFDQEQARSKLLIDEPEALAPYLRRFTEIWQEGGTPVSATVIGL